MEIEHASSECGYGSSYVCEKCLKDCPCDITLIEYMCFKRMDHINSPSGAADKVLVVWDGEKRSLEQVQAPIIRAVPLPMDTPFMTGGFRMCDGIQCKGNNCTYAHSMEEKISWNAQRFRRKKLPLQVGSSTQAIPSSDGLAAHKPLVGKNMQRYDAIYRPLQQDTYKDKFIELLKSEREVHRGRLREKCDGEYTVYLYKQGVTPHYWMRQDCYRNHSFGYLTRLSGDQIEYATQAAEGVTITVTSSKIPRIFAKIPNENYHHLQEENLYIAVVPQEMQGVLRNYQFSAEVTFELKESYFQSLSSYVQKVPPEIISRILPDKDSFAKQCEEVPPLRIEQYRQECSEDEQQFTALKAIISCPAEGPPVLVLGAFGSGKTRVLALASKYFVTECAGIRMLICTQQKASASTFLESFLNLLSTGHENIDICYITNRSVCPEAVKVCKCTADEFKEETLLRDNSRNLLAVTTCGTAGKLHPSQRGLFTHIFLDEGAFMREPEIVIPLCLASADTKLVIAGDPNQVGPTTVVLGEKASRNGLAVSLLERLHSAYTSAALQELARNYCAVLENNYRCRAEILLAARSLSYEFGVKLATKWSPPIHPNTEYPLEFICSLSDDDYLAHTSEEEARMVLNAIRAKSMPWPESVWGKKDLSLFCVVSTSRAQLSVIRKVVDREKMVGFEGLNYIPAYNIQGKQFRAVFLCTWEPKEGDGTTRIPEKSLSNPYVFNTAITRAQSLVVTVGNPFMLLKMEDGMAKVHGDKGRCWSNYLESCLKNSTIFFPRVAENEIPELTSRIREAVERRIPDSTHLQASRNVYQPVHDDSDAQGQPLHVTADYTKNRTFNQNLIELVVHKVPDDVKDILNPEK